MKLTFKDILFKKYIYENFVELLRYCILSDFQMLSYCHSVCPWPFLYISIVLQVVQDSTTQGAC